MRMVAKSGCPVMGQSAVYSGHTCSTTYSRPGLGRGDAGAGLADLDVAVAQAHLVEGLAVGRRALAHAAVAQAELRAVPGALHVLRVQQLALVQWAAHVGAGGADGQHGAVP